MRNWLSTLIQGISLGSAHAATLDPSQAKALAQEAYVFAYATVEHDKVLSAIAAKLPFNLLRLYLAKPAALDGRYRLPTIARVES